MTVPPQPPQPLEATGALTMPQPTPQPLAIGALLIIIGARFTTIGALATPQPEHPLLMIGALITGAL